MALDQNEYRGVDKAPAVKKPEKTAKQVIAENPADKEIRLEHPRHKGSGSFGLYDHEGNEKTIEFKDGIVSLQFTPEDLWIRDKLKSEGFKDLTWYGNFVSGHVKEEAKPVPIKWWFAHPDSRRENPINATVGVRLANGEEKSVTVKANMVETEDVFIAESLMIQGWPVMRTECK